MTNLQQIPQKQALTLIKEVTIKELEIIIESLDQEIIKLKGIKKELLRLK